MNTECGICAEKYNRSNRLQIQCGFCDYIACRSCCEIWIVSETIPRCMNTPCLKEWNRKFIANKFTKKFMSTTYKNHREKMLFDEQRSLLPATQPIVERQLEDERIINEINNLHTEIRRLRSLVGNTRTSVATARCAFVRACPDAECRGFLSTQWKCGICEKRTCNKCHEIIVANNETAHTCDPGNVATAELLNKDTKSCPTCGVGIHKIEGCDQMFCTMCHTAFSWRTGRIETHIHNPHYYELMRRMGGNMMLRNQDDIICGREINILFTRQLLNAMYAKQMPIIQTNYISDICRIIVHNQHELSPRYRVDHVLNHQDLRIAYLRKYIDEIEFKTRLQRTDKKTNVKLETFDIINVVHNTVTDILYRYHDMILNMETKYYQISDEKNTELNTLMGEIPRIIEYANECLNDVASTYGTVKNRFREDLTWWRG